ncbi:MAG TPA: hypothetical protein VIH37_10440, partial [Candidatus Limnocylindrales bacterium]
WRRVGPSRALDACDRQSVHRDHGSWSSLTAVVGELCTGGSTFRDDEVVQTFWTIRPGLLDEFVADSVCAERSV